MSDRVLNAATEDFVDGDDGAFSEDDVILNKLAFSYKVELGSWEGDRLLGHRFKELERVTDTAANRRLFELFAKEAIQWIVDDGDIDAADIITESFQPGAIAFQVTVQKAGRTIKAGPFLAPYGAA